MAKTATVSLHGNTYEVDAALVGRRVELVFDPFDLTELSVRYQDRDMGTAVAHQIGRHVHPGAKPETGPEPAPPTGIDYLALVRDRHTAALSARVNYADLTPAATTKDDEGGDVGIGDVGTALESELASFATLAADPPTADIYRDQLNLLTLIPDTDTLEQP